MATFIEHSQQPSATIRVDPSILYDHDAAIRSGMAIPACWAACMHGEVNAVL